MDKVEPVRSEDIQRLAENYHLIDGEKLTNLGILWIGTPRQRTGLCYPLTVQYIVYNSLEEKVRKEEWHDLSMNPKELLLDIEKNAVELTYSYEFPNGLFRKQIRHYNPKLPPEVDSSYSEFRVTQRAEIIDVELLPLLDYVMQNYLLSQKSFIAFKTSLKTIEPYALKALIKEDVNKHPGSRASEIASRIPDVGVAEIRKIIYSMAGDDLRTEGAKTNRCYFLKA